MSLIPESDNFLKLIAACNRGKMCSSGVSAIFSKLQLYRFFQSSNDSTSGRVAKINQSLVCLEAENCTRVYCGCISG